MVQELPFNTALVVVPLPGSVIAQSIAHSRNYVFANPTAAAAENPTNLPGGYLQTDDKIQYDAATNTVTHIAGAPLIPDKLYQCAVPYYPLIQGLDNITPLHEYAVQQIQLKNSSFLITEESTQESKQIIMNYYSKYILFNLLTQTSFDEIDIDHSGTITKEELLIYADKYHMREVGELMVDALMNAADADGSGCISKKEIQLLAKSIGCENVIV